MAILPGPYGSSMAQPSVRGACGFVLTAFPEMWTFPWHGFLWSNSLVCFSRDFRATTTNEKIEIRAFRCLHDMLHIHLLIAAV